MKKTVIALRMEVLAHSVGAQKSDQLPRFTRQLTPERPPLSIATNKSFTSSICLRLPVAEIGLKHVLIGLNLGGFSLAIFLPNPGP